MVAIAADEEQQRMMMIAALLSARWTENEADAVAGEAVSTVMREVAVFVKLVQDQ